MKIAFLTMVWQDYWLLERWIKNALRHVPRHHIYVINHGCDPRVDEIAKGCSVIALPRDEPGENLTELRWNLISGVASGLSAFFDYVVSTDVDEFLVLDRTDMTLGAYLADETTNTGTFGAVGLNMMPLADKTADAEAPLLARYPFARLSPRYSKPVVTSGPVEYTVGGHGANGKPFQIHPNLLLIHLHFITPDYAERMAAREEIVRTAREAMTEEEEDPGRFWVNWAKPQRSLRREMNRYKDAKDLDVEAGFEQAAAYLRSDMQKRGTRWVLGFNPDNSHRVRLPQRLHDLV